MPPIRATGLVAEGCEYTRISCSMCVMTTFDIASENMKILKHLTNIDFWTASLPADAPDAEIDKARFMAEDYANMIFESLNITPVGIAESGAVLVELTPLADDKLEDFIVEYSEKFLVSENLDD